VIPSSTRPRASDQEFRRIIGTYRTQSDGPTVVCVAGIHGNERSGVLALERVFATLTRRRPTFRGELVGLGGNLAALAEGQRYIEEDLNRIWTAERINAIRAADQASLRGTEERELRDLLGALEAAFDRATGPGYFLDLHTSSASGAPFVLLGDTLRNRRLAFEYPVPAMLGLEEQIDGVLLEYVNCMGHITLGFEAGRHDAETSIENQESAVWIAIAAAGLIDVEDIPEARLARDRLHARVGHLPSVMEITYRHPVEPGDGFEMLPGFDGFEKVAAGQVLARDHQGDIKAPDDGRILLPLYQGLGSDGFFVAREVMPFWLKVSSVLRRLRAHHIVRCLPGIRRHPNQPNAFIVSQRAARWPVPQILHLFGFRKKRLVKGKLIVSRRHYDVRGPNK
jgi:predicted deacylase